jgi:hypothetical protein
VTIVEQPPEAAEAAIRQLKQIPSRRTEVEFQNGAAEAVLLIERLHATVRERSPA